MDDKEFEILFADRMAEKEVLRGRAREKMASVPQREREMMEKLFSSIDAFDRVAYEQLILKPKRRRNSWFRRAIRFLAGE